MLKEETHAEKDFVLTPLSWRWNVDMAYRIFWLCASYWSQKLETCIHNDIFLQSSWLFTVKSCLSFLITEKEQEAGILPPWVSDPDMHHGTCVTHAAWCMSGLLTSGSLWNRWLEKRSRHSRRMRNPQFCVSGKRTMLHGPYNGCCCLGSSLRQVSSRAWHWPSSARTF